MEKGYFKRVQEQTPTRFWINNVTRKQAQLAIDNGAVGCTQNPAYTWKMMENTEEKDYVDGIIKNNAERANYMAQKTLRKVQKKIGFPERVR